MTDRLIGVLGAGQLGRMLALAGAPLGLRFRFLDPDPDACAAEFGEHLREDFALPESVEPFCDGLRAATYEFENVPAETVRAIAGRVPLRPGPRSLELTQDRLVEKRFIQSCSATTAAFVPVEGAHGLSAAIEALGLPAVLKTRRFGYDGKGQAVIRSDADLESAKMIAGSAPCILESFVSFDRELSVVIIRAEDGRTVACPPAENLHRGGILRVSIAPAPGDGGILESAVQQATAIASKLEHVGALCVEFFETEGRVLVNEIAPRVHNSGHWTIDGARTSQFENHLRAVAGFPLGPADALATCVMLNLIGDAPDPADVLARDPDACVHLYDKSPRPGRKVGHITLVDHPADPLPDRIERLSGLPGVDKDSAAAARLRVS